MAGAENHAGVDGSARADGAGEQKPHEADHKKEKSVLQAKLTKLAIQIGYAGMCLLTFMFCIITFMFIF